jgi:phosphatidylserine decarboxylase
MVKIIQIAGTVARRIVPYVHVGSLVKKGGKIGLIRLGSRVDLYLPAQKVKTLMVHMSDRIKAGETTIAEIND